MGVSGEGGSRSPVVPNQKERTTEMPAAALPLTDRQFPTTSNTGLMMEVWASVASWFFRPSESLPLTTTASNNQLPSNCTASSRPPIQSRSSTSPCTSSETSPPRYSPAATSALHQEERTDRDRMFQPPTICTSIISNKEKDEVKRRIGAFSHSSFDNKSPAKRNMDDNEAKASSSGVRSKRRKQLVEDNVSYDELDKDLLLLVNTNDKEFLKRNTTPYKDVE
ncbi:hypothetical protein FQA39_LY06490 [Lamprigera yunnana]|nr:hypothetical protein FQA39_LY06490 [Lamprigera yunnana]